MPIPAEYYFHVCTEEDVEFYNAVYSGGYFYPGYTGVHSNYVVTPGHANEPQLEIIRHIRGSVGLSDESAMARIRIPGEPRRKHLPREPVEALPLPG